ncbi:MAG: ASKHA domain-containing protein [Burkholderiales bacterium]|nr:ASKHA domain-containing protein [Burkholderiales bacterium]
MQRSTGVNPAASRRRVRFAGIDRDAECTERETIFQGARRAGVRVVGACGGRGVCGTCAVRIAAGEVELLDPPGPHARAQLANGWLRACLARPLGDCLVELSPRSLAPVARAEVEGAGGAAVEPAPAVRALTVALPRRRSPRGVADAARLLGALGDPSVARIDLGVLRELPTQLRASGWRAAVCVRGDEVIAVDAPGRRTLGLAVDFGTTNVAGFLLDLTTGVQLASLGIENPQAAYGADLVSRINHAVRAPDGAAELRRAAAGAVGALAHDLCAAASAQPREIVDVAVCGNTAMHHLLLELPVAQLGRAPFVPALEAAADYKAREVGLALAAGAWVHVLPNVGGFVGGDHVAALLATETQWDAGTSIVMDIGTNTEISLVHAGAIATVSCPSGPALEGGHISCGMRAAEGAIERVRIDGGRIEAQTIGGAEPVGLCGSGVLDAVAEMRRTGLLDARGRIQPGHPAVHDAGGRRALALAPEVMFTQEDVRAVQLAKAAVRAGIDLLLGEAGLAERAIDRVLIAGAFGAYIDVQSAIACGLVPALPVERFVQVGNAAGVGVRMALASVALRERARRIAQRCRYIELGSLAGFQQTFLGRIGFD